MEGAESRRPVYIPYRGGKRIHIGTQELMEDMGHQVQQAQANMLSTLVNMKGDRHYTLPPPLPSPQIPMALWQM